MRPVMINAAHNNQWISKVRGISEPVPCGDADDVARSAHVFNGCAGNTSVLEREEQIGAGRIDYVAGERTVDRQVLERRSAFNVIRSQLAGKDIIHSVSSVEFQSFGRPLLQLCPS